MKIKQILFCAIALCFCFGAFAQVITNASFKVLLHKTRGTFRMVSIDKAGNTKNVLSDYDEGKTSFFSVKIGRSIYKLQNTNVEGEYTDFGGGELTYTIPRKAIVEVNFLPVNSKSKDKYDVVKVTVKITNNGTRADDFALKAVFDTLLGEQTGNHFSTAAFNSINTEMQFFEMNEVRFVSSSDGTDTINFLVYGDDVTEPECVTLGIRDTLMKNNTWIPTVAKARNFDSKVTYNNSAVCMNWKEKNLGVGESYSVVFYIAIASDGEPAATSMYVRLPVTETFDVQKEPVTVPEPEPEQQPWLAQLDLEYIQAIIDRISELSMDGGNTSKDELLRLNMELDAILEQLR